jgi:hypothetical protein
LEISTKMRFILTGFTQDMGFRVFAFERVGADRVRTEFTVRADLALIRRHDIRMQELPLLCRGLLERHDGDNEPRTLTYTEEEMLIYSKDCAATRLAAALKRKSPRKPATESVGAAWRGTHPQ